MRKNKGFTLIELLAVLVILAVIGMIAFPLVSNLVSNSEKDAYTQLEKEIIQSAKYYVADNGDDLITIDATTNAVTHKDCHITLASLKTKGYLEYQDTIDPRTDENINNSCVEITYNSSYSQYTYTFKRSTTGTCSTKTACGS